MNGAALALTKFVGSSTWANMPAASAFPRGTMWLATDVGGAGGSYWRTDGSTRWYPRTGTVTLGVLAAPVTGIGTSENIAHQVLLPANFWQVGDRLRHWIGMSKSGSTDSAKYRVRIGTAGTTSDQVITGIGNAAANALAAANLSCGWCTDIELLSATSAQKKGNGSAASSSFFQSSNTGGVAAATTISNVSNPLYVSMGMICNGSTNTVGVEYSVLQLVAKA